MHSNGGYCSIDGSYEPIAAAWQCFHVTRAFRGISECLPQPGYRCVYSFFKVYKRFCRPKGLSELVAWDQLPRLLQQHRKNLKRLARQAEPHATLPELLRLQV